MHHNFSGSLHFLDTIERKVIKVAGRVEVPLLVPHDLFEKVVAAGLTLAFLHLQRSLVDGGGAGGVDGNRGGGAER